MRSDVFIYLSGPITAKNGFSIERNVADALPIFYDCIARGLPAFLPHFSAMAPTSFQVAEYATWMDYDYRIIDRCTHVLMLQRWETSTGAALEREYAMNKRMPIFYSLRELAQSLPALAVEA